MLNKKEYTNSKMYLISNHIFYQDYIMHSILLLSDKNLQNQL